jgi:Cu2+-containing amine oxidase
MSRTMNRFRLRNSPLVSVFALTALAVLATGCERRSARAPSKPSSPIAKVSQLDVQGDTQIIRGDFDYGITVRFIVVNLGEPGTIAVHPWVTSSEGEWSRVQNLYFDRGEAKQLTYFFAEPTVNATNIQGGVRTNF